MYIASVVKIYTQHVVDVNSEVLGLDPEANPTTVNYNASAVKIYNATSSIERSEYKIFSSALKTMQPTN
jgi:hypothetical protein